MTGTWALCGALVLPAAGQPAARGDIVIAGERIVAVGPDLDLDALGVTRREDAARRLVMPGLVNTHYHSHDRWDRGRFDTLPLELWMTLYNPPGHARNWTPDEIYLRTLLGGMELLRGGSTAVMDDVHLGTQLDDASIEAVFRAYGDLGIRADVGIAMSDLPGHETIPHLAGLLPEALKTRGQLAAKSQGEMLDIWQRMAARHDGRVRAVVSVSGPQRCSCAFQQQAQALADSLGRPLLTHVLETRVQAMTAHAFHGRPMVGYMRDIGALSANTVVIHGVWLTPAEMDLIAEAGAGVAHNPVSNAKLGSGIAPLRPMLARGIGLGLGTDNHNANDACSMLEALKFGALLQHLAAEDHAEWLTAVEALRIATEGGARLMGMAGSLGRLAPGMKADLIAFDLHADAFVPLNDPVNQTVFAGSAAALAEVYVDGRRLLAAGRVETVDEDALRAEVAARVESLQRRVLDGIPAAQAIEPYLREAYARCRADPLMAPYRGRLNCCHPAPAG